MTQRPLDVDEALDLVDRGRYAEAVSMFGRVPFDGERPEAFAALGWALENLGPDRLGEARTAYERALQLDPSSLDALEGLGNVLSELAERDAAAECFRRVVASAGARHDPDSRTLELAGWSAFRLGDLPMALGFLDHALRMEPGSLAVRLDRALVVLAAGRDRDAAAAYHSALAMHDGTERDDAIVRVALDDLRRTCRDLGLGVGSAAPNAAALLADALCGSASGAAPRAPISIE